MFVHTRRSIRCPLSFIFFVLFPASSALQSRSLIKHAPSPSLNGSSINNVTSDDMNVGNNSLSSANSTSFLTYETPTWSFMQKMPSGSSTFLPFKAIVLVIIATAFISMGFLFLYIQHYCRITGETNNLPSHNSASRGTSALISSLFPFFRSPNVGLGLRSLSSLPTLRFSTAESFTEAGGKTTKDFLGECMVCLSSFQEGEEIRLLPNCGHCFHQGCIDMWLFSHVTCPLCRSNIPLLRK